MSTDMFDRSRSRTRREYQPSEENVSYVGSDRNETAYEGINVEGNNESMLVVSSTNPTAIFSAIKERDWSTVVNLCLNAPENHAGTWIVEKNVDRSIRWKLLPIHQVKNFTSRLPRIFFYIQIMLTLHYQHLNSFYAGM